AAPHLQLPLPLSHPFRAVHDESGFHGQILSGGVRPTPLHARNPREFLPLSAVRLVELKMHGSSMSWGACWSRWAKAKFLGSHLSVRNKLRYAGQLLLPRSLLALISSW